MNKKKKCYLAHLAHDNINNLPDEDSPRQYPDEPARVPGAGGHSPQEILGLQGIHSEIFIFNLCSSSRNEFFKKIAVTTPKIIYYIYYISTIEGHLHS
jgi:hypothetical protein